MNPAFQTLAGHGLNASVIYPLFRIFDPGLFSLSRGGKGLMHSKAFKRSFTVFMIRDKNVGHPTAAIVTH